MPAGTVVGADRRRLADALRDIRTGTGLSQAPWGKRIGKHQTWVSKVEDVKIQPDDDAIIIWCTAGGADPAPVLALARPARVEARTVREAYAQAGGAAGYQAALGALERQTLVKCKFQPVMMPAEVQTPTYAEAIFRGPSGPLATGGITEGEIPGLVAARMRNQLALYEPGRLVRVVVLEAALRHPMAPPDVMRAQLDRLLTVAATPSLEFGVIPFGRELPVAPITGWIVFDDSHVTVESVTGPTDLSAPDEVALYQGWFELLARAAVYERGVTPLVEAAIAALPAS